MIIRVQTKDGVKRFEIEATDTLQQLAIQIVSKLQLPSNQAIHLFRDQKRQDELQQDDLPKCLINIPLRHGDMLYLDAVMSPGSQVSMAAQQVKQDEVDNILQEKDGRIYREINVQLCHHGPQGKCLNCAPLEVCNHGYQ